MSSGYVTIKLPRNLIDEVDNFVGKYGFVSRTEVVKEALRRFFQQYSNITKAQEISGRAT